MGTIHLIYLFAITLVIGGIVGFGCSTRRVTILWYHLAGIVLLTFIISLVSLYMGKVMGGFFSVRVVEVMVGLGLIGIGTLLAIIKPEYPGLRDLLLFVCALEMDVLLLSYHYAQNDDRGYTLAYVICFLLLGSIVGGLMFGQRRWANWRVKLLLPISSAVLLIMIGLVKVL